MTKYLNKIKKYFKDSINFLNINLTEISKIL